MTARWDRMAACLAIPRHGLGYVQLYQIHLTRPESYPTSGGNRRSPESAGGKLGVAGWSS